MLLCSRFRLEKETYIDWAFLKKETSSYTRTPHNIFRILLCFKSLLEKKTYTNWAFFEKETWLCTLRPHNSFPDACCDKRLEGTMFLLEKRTYPKWVLIIHTQTQQLISRLFAAPATKFWKFHISNASGIFGFFSESGKLSVGLQIFWAQVSARICWLLVNSITQT